MEVERVLLVGIVATVSVVATVGCEQKPRRARPLSQKELRQWRKMRQEEIDFTKRMDKQDGMLLRGDSPYTGYRKGRK